MATTTTNQTSTFIPPLDIILSQIRIPKFTTQLNLWGYLFTLLLGFIGNTLGFFTFFRPTLRNASTSCLFILLIISNNNYT